MAPSRASARSNSVSAPSRLRARLTRPLTAFAAAALVGPALVVVATSASAVSTPAISDVAGFPVDVNRSDPGLTTIDIPTPASAAVGNLVLVAVDTHVVTATGVSSPNTTGWTEITHVEDSHRNLSIWRGTVTANGADTLTVSYSGPIMTGVYTEISADELTSTAGASTAWAAVAQGTASSSADGLNVVWPSLTSTAAGQAYWGFGSGSSNTQSGPILPAGFSATLWGGNSANVTILNPALSAAAAFTPTWAQSPEGNYTTIGVIVSAAGSGTFKPGAPTGVLAVRGDTQATVSWTPPVSDGGASIDSYTVTSSPGNHTGSTAGTTVAVTGLTNGTAYTFTVTAHNTNGTGLPSDPSDPVTPAGVPFKPAAPVATTTSVGQAGLTWTAPASNGSAITGYSVTVIPSAGTAVVTGTTANVTGLTGGTSYTFTVQAINGVGTGPSSDPSNAVVPASGGSGNSGGGGGGTTPSAPVRLSGADRFGTAIAASTAEFPTAGSAGAVVLARSDDFPDALVGSPLAKAKNGPLLFASGGVLTPETTAEIQRVLPAGGTVYILGGTTAVPASVATTLTGLGFTVNRLAGADRYATAIMVAGVIGNPGTVLLATGTNFPDALSAGPAAAHLGGAVLLTNGSTLPGPVSAYLTAYPGTVYAVGGPAALADPSATPLTGADRYATAAAVGSLFSSPTLVGIASGVTFPDALTGGAYEAHVGGPLLLTDPAMLPSSTSSYLTGAKTSILTTDIFGGTTAISAAVQTAIGTALGL